MAKKITNEQKIEVVNLYNSGYKVPEISKEIKISPTSINKILKESGIVLKKPASITRRTFSKSDKQKIIRLYVRGGKNTNEIAKQFNTYNTSIRRILLANNIELRGRGVAQRFVELSDIENKVGTRDFDYFLGLLATDGCVTGNKIVLDFSEENKELLDYWNKFLGGKCNINCSLHKLYKVPQYRISFRNKEIAEFLADYGIVPNKTFDLTLKYINWDVFRGILDGDGCVSPANYGSTLRILITSGCLKFLNQIKEFLDSEGIYSYIKETNRSLHPVYNLTINRSDDIIKLYNKMYYKAHYFLKRKKLKFGPLLEKFNKCNSVNSGKELCASNPEPSPENREGVETLHGTPKEIF